MNNLCSRNKTFSAWVICRGGDTKKKTKKCEHVKARKMAKCLFVHLRAALNTENMRNVWFKSHNA